MLNAIASPMRKLRLLKADTRAVTAMEYGLIASLIFVVIITGITQVQTNVVALWALVASKI